jgi:hypothetical protein
LELKATEFAKGYAREHDEEVDKLLKAPPSRIAAYMPMRFVPAEDLSDGHTAKPINIDFSPSSNVRVSLTQKTEPKK